MNTYIQHHMLKKQIHLYTLCLLVTSIWHDLYAPELGDPCVCTNTNAKGIYLPSPEHNNQLICNCHNFSLLPSEFSHVFAARLHTNEEHLARINHALTPRSSLSAENKKIIRKIFIIATELFKKDHNGHKPTPYVHFTTPHVGSITVIRPKEMPIVYNPAEYAAILKEFSVSSEVSAKSLAQILQTLLQEHLPLILSIVQDPADPEETIITQLKDNCSAIGQSCRCSNTDLPGVCSMNTEQIDKSGHSVCWRCRELSCNCD